MPDDGDWAETLALFTELPGRDDPAASLPVEAVQDTDEFEFLEDDGDGSRDDASCSSTSVLSSVYEDEVIYGRRYHGYKRGRYPLPNDEIEQQREEINHALMLHIAEGRLFLADIGNNPQKILDIGTGIGIWAIDVADQYASASVVGTDLSAIQPQWVPVNVRMFVEDCEEPDWLHGSGFDLIHYRGMAGVVQDFDALISKAFPHVKDGGWIEVQEIIPKILCDDNTMSSDDPLRLLFDASVEGMRKLGCKPFNVETLRASLENAGLVNVQCVVKKVPISPWPAEKRLAEAGLLMKTATKGILTALAAKPLAALDIPAQNRRSLVGYARTSLDNDRIHRYVNCCFCYGQKL